MRLSARRLAVAALFALASLQLVAAQTGPAKKAIDVYREYLAAAKTAKTIAPILPFLTKEYAANLQGAPKAQQDRMLTGFQEHATRTAIVVTKETIKGDTCELQATAKDADGSELLGKVAFVNEAGAWKIEGQGWVPDYEKQFKKK